MSALMLAAALAASLAATAPASASRMEPAFANTLVSTYPDGRHGRLWLQADGTWRAISRNGHSSGGRWSQKGERLCMRQSRPIPIFFSYCTPMVAGGVGASWRAKAPTGEPITVELVAGREGEPQG